MRTITIVCAALACGLSGASLACEMPGVVLIPAKDAIAGKEAEVQTAANAYFAGVRAYVQCVQVELTAAGGDDAPELTKTTLLKRATFALNESKAIEQLLKDAGFVQRTPP